MIRKSMLGFKEGPFFLLETTVYPSIGRRVVVWAPDETTARNVVAFKLNMPTAYITIQHLGDLDNLKKALRLSSVQLTDLHSKGYLKL